MALKLAAFAAILLVVAATISEASIYRDANPRCREERRRLESCRSFLMHGRPYELATEVKEPANQEAPEQCCRQVRQMREECRCPALREMARDMAREQGFEGEEECRGRCGEMMQRAQYLPSMCGVGPESCRMRQGGGYY